jgi:hypothetical protein
MKKLISTLTAVLLFCSVLVMGTSAVEPQSDSAVAQEKVQENLQIITEIPQEPFCYDTYGNDAYLLISDNSVLKELHSLETEYKETVYNPVWAFESDYAPYFFWRGELYNMWMRERIYTGVYSVQLYTYKKKLLFYTPPTYSFSANDFPALNIAGIVDAGVIQKDNGEILNGFKLDFSTYEDTINAFKVLKSDNRIEEVGIEYRLPSGIQKMSVPYIPDDYTFSEKMIPLGDTSIDNQVNTADLVYYLAYSQGEHTFDEAIYNNVADINGDGVVDGKDYRLCAEKIFGKAT